VQAIPYSAVLVVGRYRAVAAVTALMVAVQIVLTLVAGSLDSARLLALAFPVANIVNLVAALLLVSRRLPALVAPPVTAILARMLAVAALTFGAAAAAAHALDPPARDWIALAAGLAAYGAVVVAFLPAERDLAGRLGRAILPARG
jgi:hypothetical protein